MLDFIKRNIPFEIKVYTRTNENKIVLEQNKIKVKITEIPENGKANKAIINLFSKTLKIPKSNIEILSGFTNQIKKIIIYE